MLGSHPMYRQKFALETATYILAGRFSVSRVPGKLAAS